MIYHHTYGIIISLFLILVKFFSKFSNLVRNYKDEKKDHLSLFILNTNII